jgi:hypothetical protein
LGSTAGFCFCPWTGTAGFRGCAVAAGFGG